MGSDSASPSRGGAPSQRRPRSSGALTRPVRCPARPPSNRRSRSRHWRRSCGRRGGQGQCRFLCRNGRRSATRPAAIAAPLPCRRSRARAGADWCRQSRRRRPRGRDADGSDRRPAQCANNHQRYHSPAQHLNRQPLCPAPSDRSQRSRFGSAAPSGPVRSDSQ